MKRQLLVALVGILMLLSLTHVAALNVAAARSTQTSSLKAERVDERIVMLPSAITGDEAADGNNYNSAYKAGKIPTQIISLDPDTTDLGSVQVGDPATIHAKLIRTDTGAGIPGAPIRAAASMDNKTWYDFGNYFMSTCPSTDSNGEFGQTLNVPDPRPYAPFPATYYIRYTYEGSSTYAASSITYYVTALRPTGTIPTQMIPLMMNIPSTVHVGDPITVRGKLIRTDTGAGIPGANIRAAGSTDNKTWLYSPPGVSVTTDSTGVANLTFNIPDPRPYIQLPATIYFKVLYSGNSTYAPTSYSISGRFLPPLSTTTTAPTLMQAPQRRLSPP